MIGIPTFQQLPRVSKSFQLEIVGILWKFAAFEIQYRRGGFQRFPKVSKCFLGFGKPYCAVG